MTEPRKPDESQQHQRRVFVFDTTLRDGEQTPGFSMNQRAKLRMAHMLESLGVDVLEAGFPSASPDDYAAVAQIARALRETTVCALARCHNGDIDIAARALDGSQNARIHVFIASSPLHRKHKLGMSREQVLDSAAAGVARAASHGFQVEFSAEDAMRTEPDFLVELFNVAIEAGASVLNAPDTVGYVTPAEIAERFTHLRTHVRGVENVILSAHCHDDLGLAVANSLAALDAGARQVECTVNGIGERAGNAALEEIVMALRVRRSLFELDTQVDSRKLYPASRLLAQLTGQPVQRNKAVVGENAFAHESGIHQHGMLRHAGTYEIMRPQDVGIADTRLVLGKHSGRAALRQRLKVLGHEIADSLMDSLFERFKALADKKREVSDEDLEAMVLGQDPDALGPWQIVQLHANTHMGGSASAMVRLRHDSGRESVEAALGDGPVDAVLRALERATGQTLDITEFQVRAISAGGDAQGQAHLIARTALRELSGHAVSTDIVEATAQAALQIINRIERHPSAGLMIERCAGDLATAPLSGAPSSRESVMEMPA